MHVHFLLNHFSFFVIVRVSQRISTFFPLLFLRSGALRVLKFQTFFLFLLFNKSLLRVFWWKKYCCCMQGLMMACPMMICWVFSSFLSGSSEGHTHKTWLCRVVFKNVRSCCVQCPCHVIPTVKNHYNIFYMYFRSSWVKK